MEFVSEEYEQRLKRLASILCPIKDVVQFNPLTIPRTTEEEVYSFQYDIEDIRTGFDINGNFHRTRNRWDSEGCYLTRDI
ncbi:MAG: hypothetical protein WCJ60_02300 [bacterium]